jgi:hypothetical protein
MGMHKSWAVSRAATRTCQTTCGNVSLPRCLLLRTEIEQPIPLMQHSLLRDTEQRSATGAVAGGFDKFDFANPFEAAVQ